jgi:hypothetical protein
MQVSVLPGPADSVEKPCICKRVTAATSHLARNVLLELPSSALMMGFVD